LGFELNYNWVNVRTNDQVEDFILILSASSKFVRDSLPPSAGTQLFGNEWADVDVADDDDDDDGDGDDHKMTQRN